MEPRTAAGRAWCLRMNTARSRSERGLRQGGRKIQNLPSARKNQNLRSRLKTEREHSVVRDKVTSFGGPTRDTNHSSRFCPAEIQPEIDVDGRRLWPDCELRSPCRS